MSSSGRRATMTDVATPGTVVVCFAVPDESRLFRAALARRRAARPGGPHFHPTVYGEWAGCPVAVIHTGVGESPDARTHVARALTATLPPPRAVISAGYAGALHAGLAVGDVVLGENHSSPALVAQARAWLQTEPARAGGLVTVPEAVESAAEKSALHRTSGALAVDMETAWIAGACAAAGLPLLSLRVISDAADQDFPVPGRVLYDAVRQRPRYLALPAWLALHPGRIVPFVRFVWGLRPARTRLTRALGIVVARLHQPPAGILPPPPKSAMGGVFP